MNWSAITGLIVALSLTLMSILWTMPIAWLVDLGSVVLIVIPLPLMVMVAHGWEGLTRGIFGGLRAYLAPALAGSWTPGDAARSARVAETASLLSLLLGAVGTLLGLVMMLQRLDDPSAIGPAFAVAMLSIFYAVALNVFLFIPLRRHMQLQAAPSDGPLGGSIEPSSPMWGGLALFALFALAIGMTFLLMLLAMGV